MLCCIGMKINKYFQNSTSLSKFYILSVICVSPLGVFILLFLIIEIQLSISGADYFAVVTMNKEDEIKPFRHNSKAIIKDICKKIGWLMKTNTSTQVHKRDKIAKDHEGEIRVLNISRISQLKYPHQHVIKELQKIYLESTKLSDGNKLPKTISKRHKQRLLEGKRKKARISQIEVLQRYKRQCESWKKE